MIDRSKVVSDCPNTSGSSLQNLTIVYLFRWIWKVSSVPPEAKFFNKMHFRAQFPLQSVSTFPTFVWPPTGGQISSIYFKNTPPCYRFVINKGGILNNRPKYRPKYPKFFGACGGLEHHNPHFRAFQRFIDILHFKNIAELHSSPIEKKKHII